MESAIYLLQIEQIVHTMVNMTNIKELIILAIIFLMERNGKQARDIATAGEVSVRQVQYVLNSKGKRGFAPGTTQKIAALFGYSFNELLTIGQAVFEGRDPYKVIAANRNPTALHQSATVTNGLSIQSGRDSNVGVDPSISAQDRELIALLMKYGNQAIKQELLAKLKRIQQAVEGT